jgi:MFS family permease
MFGPVLAVFVKPMGDDLGWSRTSISLGFTLGSFAGSMGSAAIGGFLDRHGARGAIVVSGVVITGCLLGLAAIAQPWHFWLFFGVGRGVALAGVQAGTTVATANWFIRKRGRAMAFGGVGLRLGQTTLPLVVHAIMVALSWRHAYAALAGMAFALIALPGGLFVRRRPEDLGMMPDGRSPGEPEVLGRPAAGRPPGVEESWTLREAIRTPALWLMMVTVAGIGFAQTAVNLHAIASFVDRGIPAGLAVIVTTITYSLSAGMSLAWGFLMERVHVRYTIMIVSGLYIGAMLVIMVADVFALAVVYGLLFGLAQGGWTVAQRLLFPDYFGRRHVGAIRGFSELVTGVVNPLGPLLAGIVRDVTGSYTIAFATFAGVFALSLVAMALAVPPRRSAAA